MQHTVRNLFLAQKWYKWWLLVLRRWSDALSTYFSVVYLYCAVIVGLVVRRHLVLSISCIVYVCLGIIVCHYSWFRKPSHSDYVKTIFSPIQYRNALGLIALWMMNCLLEKNIHLIGCLAVNSGSHWDFNLENRVNW